MDASATSPVLTRGRYRVRMAEGADDLSRAQALRGRLFLPGTGKTDSDGYDSRCDHVLIEDAADGDLVACFRFLTLPDGRALGDSYSAQYYDLRALAAYPGAMLELGRFCAVPERRDPDVLRAAWAAIVRLGDAAGVRMLFGCSSFAGTDAHPYRDAFALLRRHLAPARWRPGVKAPRVVAFSKDPVADERRAMSVLPPLLRSYLAMGGWVSGHAVVDPEMNTLHVFTGVELGAIPQARLRLLRASAG